MLSLASIPAMLPAVSQAADSVPNDLIHMTRTFAGDAFHIYTFPLHMSGRDAAVLSGVLAVTGLIYAYDQEILDAVQRNEESDLWKPLWETGDFFEPLGHMGNTNIWYMGGVVLGYATRQEKFSLVCAQILESHYIGGMGKNLIQHIVGRQRPYGDLGPREFGVDNATSFPSGHSNNIFQLPVILSHHVDHPAFTVLAYSVAASVGIQRVRSNMHWPSDVFFSSFYGWSVAKGVLRLHEGRQTTVAPHVSRLGVGLEVTVCSWPEWSH